MTLAALQTLFWRAARGEAALSDLDQAFVANRAGSGAARMRVYNGAYFGRLERALADSFPVTRELLGEPRFVELARRYIIRFPSQEPALERVGGNFPAMLAARALGEEALIARVAALEWARIEALLAPEDEALTSLAGVAPADLTFHWVRSLRLCRTSVACFRALQRKEQPATDGDHLLTVAFWRQGFQVRCRTLERAEELALQGAAHALPLLVMCERLGGTSAEDAALPFLLVQRWLAQGWIRRVGVLETEVATDLKGRP